MKHPIQPLALQDGVLRFKANKIVEFLLEWATQRGCGLNELACMAFSNEDRQQLAQLIGYSLGGYSELSYVDDQAYEVAEKVAGLGQSEDAARIAWLEEELTLVRESLRPLAARLFRVHEDDLTG